MFIQVMEGRVADIDGLRTQLDRWATELQSGADGWLGTTAGITGEGTFIGVVRFESEAAARANSERPEQGAWWADVAPTFDGDVAFTDCPVVDTFGAGGSDEAGFVQVIKGRADRDKVQPFAQETEAILRRMRPDVLGGTFAWAGNGAFVQTVYFTSEADARAAEGAGPAEEDREAWEQLNALMEYDGFADLSDPWLFSR